ncbi:uncharacterized protein LOC122505845 [Leptopilina heterotoma]|uniref:uncharacterized protein LOC122505845 n=1 Tax=Leptopilina heterotoma TaxID=63436 RepID=UPI001CA9D89C|nr:uncharacterized protein LOC122505845 [Leptopilina heterotoma]
MTMEKSNEGVAEKIKELEKKSEVLNASYKRKSGKYKTSGIRLSKTKAARARRQRQKEEKLAISASMADKDIEGQLMEMENMDMNESTFSPLDSTSNGKEDIQVGSFNEIVF